jgi:hypothetical protein
MSKLFCKSLGSRIGIIQSYEMLDSGSMIRILYRCCIFFLWEYGLPHDTLQATLWAHRRWYQAMESGSCTLPEDDYARINLILNELLMKVQVSVQKVTNFHLQDELTEDSLGLGIRVSSSQSSQQSSVSTEKDCGSTFTGSAIEVANLGDVSEIPDDVQERIEYPEPFDFDCNDQLFSGSRDWSERQFKKWLQSTQAERWAHALH